MDKDVFIRNENDLRSKICLREVANCDFTK